MAPSAFGYLGRVSEYGSPLLQASTTSAEATPPPSAPPRSNAKEVHRVADVSSVAGPKPVAGSVLPAAEHVEITRHVGKCEIVGLIVFRVDIDALAGGRAVAHDYVPVIPSPARGCELVERDGAFSGQAQKRFWVSSRPISISIHNWGFLLSLIVHCTESTVLPPVRDLNSLS